MPDGKPMKLKTWETSKNLVWTGANIFRFTMYAGVLCTKIPSYFSPGLYSLAENRPYMPKGFGADVCRSGDIFINPGVSSAFVAYNDATVFQLDTAAKKEKAGVPMLYVSMSSPCNFKKDTVLKNDPSAYVLFTPPVRKASLFSAKPATPKGLYRLEHLTADNQRYNVITVGSQADPNSNVLMCQGMGAWRILLTLSNQETTKFRTYSADSGSGIAMPPYQPQTEEYVVNDPISTGNLNHTAIDKSGQFVAYPGHPRFSYKVEELGDTIGDSAPYLTISLLAGPTGNENHPYWYTNQSNMEWVGNAMERRAVDMFGQQFYCIAGTDTVANEWRKLPSDGKKYITGANAKSDITLEFDNTNFKVGNIQGHSKAVYTTNVKRADMFPPTLRGVQIRSRVDGKITTRHKHLRDARISFAGGDFNYDPTTGINQLEKADVKLEIAPFGTTEYTTVPISELSDYYMAPVWTNYYEADLSGYHGKSVNGWFDLRFTLTDKAGNKCVQTASPALFSENGTIGVGAIENAGMNFALVGDVLYSGSDSARVMVYDAAGRMVASATGNVSVAALPQGLYVATAVNDGKTATLKFVKR